MIHVLCACLLVMTACAPTSDEPLLAGATLGPGRKPVASSAAPKGDLRVLLDEHNRYRAQHCAPPLRWSNELAAVAARWAARLARSCRLEHSMGDYGENLAAGTSGALGATRVAELWYREVDKYDFGRGGFAMETGHFTQLVWRGTSRLGCAVSSCKGLDIWVCEYDLPGNVEGQYRDNVRLAGRCD